jgi:Tfp pilus assembly protein PilF
MSHQAKGNPVFQIKLWLSATFLVAFVFVLANGQGGVGSTRGLPETAGGIHTIQGKIFLPSGQRAHEGIVVRLSSNIAGSRSASTDSDGVFVFNGLPAAEYRLVIDAGPEYTQQNRSVVIYGTTGGSIGGGGRAGQTMMVDITLVAKEDQFPGVPKEAVEAYRKGMQAVQSGDSKKAVESLRTAVTLHPKFGAALTELGTQYLKLNDAPKAVEVLKQATEVTPASFAAHLRYGIALLNDKKPADAEQELRGALKINAASPAAHMYLGIALLSLSRDEKTKEFHADKYADAQKELETAASTGKEEVAMAHRYLGGIYWAQKDYKQAADELETYLKLEPKAPDAERTKTAIKDLRSKQ